MPRDKGEQIKRATERKIDALVAKYSGTARHCSYHEVDDGLYTMRACGDEPVKHKVSFADGTTLWLCDGHAKWYRSIHPLPVPIVKL